MIFFTLNSISSFVFDIVTLIYHFHEFKITITIQLFLALRRTKYKRRKNNQYWEFQFLHKVTELIFELTEAMRWLFKVKKSQAVISMDCWFICFKNNTNCKNIQTYKQKFSKEKKKLNVECIGGTTSKPRISCYDSDGDYLFPWRAIWSATPVKTITGPSHDAKQNGWTRVVRLAAYYTTSWDVTCAVTMMTTNLKTYCNIQP